MISIADLALQDLAADYALLDAERVEALADAVTYRMLYLMSLALLSDALLEQDKLRHRLTGANERLAQMMGIERGQERRTTDRDADES